jgi:hypothetical protein
VYCIGICKKTAISYCHHHLTAHHNRNQRLLLYSIIWNKENVERYSECKGKTEKSTTLSGNEKNKITTYLNRNSCIFCIYVYVQGIVSFMHMKYILHSLLYLYVLKVWYLIRASKGYIEMKKGMVGQKGLNSLFRLKLMPWHKKNPFIDTNTPVRKLAFKQRSKLAFYLKDTIHSLRSYSNKKSTTMTITDNESVTILIYEYIT